jgi:sugar/nucleoside kinase (ribokinase family)
VVCVDPAFGETTLQVAQIAHEAGLPVVTCDSRADSALARIAAVNVVSGEMMAREYPEANSKPEVRAALFDEYLERSPGLVVFTAGTGPVWYGRGRRSALGAGCCEPGRRFEMETFSIEVVDSAGAGDSFRGGLIHGMLRGWCDADMVRFACAVAALVCTTAPGCLYPPTAEQVSELITRHGHAAPGGTE